MGPTMERVSADGIDLEVAVQGSGDDVVFIHGGGFADSYLALASNPAVHDHYRTICYRRRGHAGSSPTHGVTPVSSHAHDCRALLSELGVARAHVVGHSYGGAVALQMAVDAPEVVATVATFEPPLLAVASGPRFSDELGPTFGMYRSGNQAAALHAFSTVVGGPDWRTNVERTIPGGVEQAEKDAATLFESDLPSLATWAFGAEQAATITQPVLYVLGSDTLPFFGEGRDLLDSWLPRMETAVLAGATHMLQIERPGDAAAALADFLQRHPAAPWAREPQ